MIEVTIPMSLCGMELSKNGRTHWRTRHRAFQDQKEWVMWSLNYEVAAQWPAAIMDIEWCYSRGRHPDDDNAIARVAAARDAFEDYGIVANDKDIRVGQVLFTKVKQGEECVVVSLRLEER